MGFNSVLMICNDAIHAIEKDPAGWWAEAWHSLSHAWRKPVEFGFGSHANGFWGVCNHHADMTSLIAVGGNHPTLIHQGSGPHHTDEGVVDLLKQAAAKYGYRLVRDKRLDKITEGG